jgi:hypothetical protein
VAVTVYGIPGNIAFQMSCSFSQAKAVGMSQGSGCDAANCMYVDTKHRRHSLWSVPSGRLLLLTFLGSRSGARVDAGLDGEPLTRPYNFLKKFQWLR